MQVGNNGGNGKLPLKPNREINHDAHDHEKQRQDTIGCEFFSHLGAYKLHTPHLNAWGRLL